MVSSNRARCRRRLPAFTQFPRVPSLIPRSRATCAIGLPVSRTSRTAPSRKSRSNFLRVSAIAYLPLRRCVHATRGNPPGSRAWFVAEPGEVDGAGGVEGFLRGAGGEAGAQDGVLVAVVGGGVDREAEGMRRAAVAQAA